MVVGRVSCSHNSLRRSLPSNQEDRSACGSRSISNTLTPKFANIQAILAVRVVLPTPPLSLKKVTVFMLFSLRQRVSHSAQPEIQVVDYHFSQVPFVPGEYPCQNAEQIPGLSSP